MDGSKSIRYASNTHRHPILEVPPEIWGQVAALASRQAIACLCAASHIFYSRISPLLYGVTTYPPLTRTQSTLLIRTIRSVRASVHPIHAIRTVSFSDNPRHCREALWNLADISSPGQPIRGALLRSLEWNLPETAGLRILLAPGYFPNLMQISVCATVDKSKTGFDFVRIPGLEKLEFSLEFIVGKDPKPCGRSLAALGKALALLPSSSPLLQTLRFGLEINPEHYYRAQDDTNMDSLWEAYSRLVQTTNEMRFSALTSVELSVELSSFLGEHSAPRTNLVPLLLGNPSLMDIMVNVEEMRIPIDAVYAANFRSFTGSVEQCAAVVSAHAQSLEQLHITGYDYPDEDVEDPLSVVFNPTRFSSNAGPALRHLTVRRPTRSRVRFPEFSEPLSPRAFRYLVLAFSNVTHLDVRLEQESKISAYSDSFVALPHLEYLRMYRSEFIDSEDWDTPPTVIFPAQRYAAKINKTLRPFLPRLSEVHVFLLGLRETNIEEIGCPCCESWDSRPPHRVEYRFCRELGKAKFALVETHIREA
ncbi:hypothetical protein DFH06DRAFT_1471740 [Mycena polygramma]|nr:hypothetical protein DFH06DRAFT_1471740 [Mycena polygramma]